ncbi:hypothetical protein [uncultured Psychroserpens sp.]|uniref:hypothetical protein n=1 Tax=uncultured Psychroserpens sp. TaxID=255436 RepID=UPI002604C06A|nr:hypothetical protein [uncultured Psychroserpens sp.]
MKQIFVRINAWFSTIFYMIMALVSLLIMFIEGIDYGIIITLFMFIVMSATGWFAHKFGLVHFKIHRYSKVTAIITLVFGLFFLVLTPIMFNALFNFEESLTAIAVLFLTFIPAMVSGIAILFGNSKGSVELTE